MDALSVLTKRCGRAQKQAVQESSSLTATSTQQACNPQQHAAHLHSRRRTRGGCSWPMMFQAAALNAAMTCGRLAAVAAQLLLAASPGPAAAAPAACSPPANRLAGKGSSHPVGTMLGGSCAEPGGTQPGAPGRPGAPPAAAAEAAVPCCRASDPLEPAAPAASPTCSAPWPPKRSWCSGVESASAAAGRSSAAAAGPWLPTGTGPLLVATYTPGAAGGLQAPRCWLLLLLPAAPCSSCAEGMGTSTDGGAASPARLPLPLPPGSAAAGRRCSAAMGPSSASTCMPLPPSAPASAAASGCSTNAPSSVSVAGSSGVGEGSCTSAVNTTGRPWGWKCTARIDRRVLSTAAQQGRRGTVATKNGVRTAAGGNASRTGCRSCSSRAGWPFQSSLMHRARCSPAHL